MTEQRIVHPDGTGINLRSWPVTQATAVVVLQHGFNAHGGHLQWPAEQFNAAGYACYAVDLRGRGKSDGERYFVEEFGDYLTDLQLAFDRARADHPGLPIFLIGHSAGGVIATSYALKHQAQLAGLICHSFAFRVPTPRFVLDLAQWIGGFLPRIGVLKLKNADFSRDPAHVAMMDADPLIANETQPAHTVGEMWKADKQLEVAFGAFSMPLLIIHGTADRATLPAGSRLFFDRAGSADKTLKLYDGHVHDLLADTGKDAIMADILGWIAARLPARA